MLSHGQGKVGRNDPCPCGSGKKYKRCCLEQQSTAYSFWVRQRGASDQLTRDILEFAESKCGQQIEAAWQDFNMTDLPVPLDAYPGEQQIFMPFFLFHWDPQRPRTGKGATRRGGIVSRWYELEKGTNLSDLQRLLLEQATTQPFSFFEVLWNKAGEGIGLRDILLGTETDVVERSASRTLQKGDIVYGQMWNLQTLSILGCSAPIPIPPRWKGEVIGLRKKLRKKMAKHNRDLIPDDLARHSDAVRLTYLTIRDGLYTPPRLANTDGDPLVFHTLKFRIESAEEAFDALAPLAFGQSREDLLEDAEFSGDGKLQRIEFDWRKKGNAKIPSWDNTILGHIRISGRSLIAEVNSENRARRLRAEIEKRVGSSAMHQSTNAKTVGETLSRAPKRTRAQAKEDDELERALLHDPEARGHFQQIIQRQVEGWVYHKVPALGGRTPVQAVQDPDGREIVESLLLDWERLGAYQAGVRPDFNAVRKLLNLPLATP
jgi:SEC-C motif